jgi:DNA processing protein
MPDAPAVLHVAGDPAELLAAGDDVEPCAAAVVGARRATEYGLEVARELGRELGAAGVRVVSGLALGIDSAAHAGALAGGGATVAVLAGSAEVAYPASKRRLYAEIVRRCCVVSEMPPGYRPYRWNFPARNRIIAGLAAVTVVVEAAARSGSLITAELAMGLGRAVGAVPGPVLGERSAGTNGLLHDGAHVVRGAQDVLDVLLAHGFTTPALVPAGRAAPPEPELAALLDHVDAGRATPGAVAAATGDLTAATVGLARLELLGHVRRVPGGRYVRTA